MKTLSIPRMGKQWLGVIVLLALSMPLGIAGASTTISQQLRKAVQRGDVAEIKALLERGADINEEVHGETPIMAAIREKRTDLVQILLEKGADPNLKTRDQHGWTPLQKAFGSVDRKEPFIVFLRASDRAACKIDGFKPTNKAASLDDRDAAIVQLLVKHGANPNSQIMYGTILSWAAILGQEDLAQLLLDKGADVDLKSSDGKTPLFWAAVSGNDNVVRLLRGYGAMKSLHEAAMIGDKTEVQRLLKAGADVNGRNDCGRTPLMEAARGGDPQTLKTLLKNGADPNLKTADGATALTVATWRANLEAAKVLLSNRANVNAANKYGRTAFVDAAWEGNFASAVGGTSRLVGAGDEGLNRITKNSVYYEMREYRPDPESTLGAAMQR